MGGRKPLEKLEEVGELTSKLEEAIKREHGYRGKKALRLVKKGMIFHQNEDTYVWGDHGVYRTEEDRCSCPAGYVLVKEGFMPKYPGKATKPVIPKMKRKSCSHSLAVRIARALGKGVEVSEEKNLEDYLLELREKE